MSSKQSTPFVSVIIPAHNEEGYLRQCLNSVLSQTYPHDRMEVLVVDNDSSDATPHIANELLYAEGRGKVLHKRGGTIAAVRNFGRVIASGEILVFLDADCIVDPKWMRLCVDNFNNEDIAIVGTRAIPDLYDSTWVEQAWYNMFSGIEKPDYPDWLGTSNLFVRKNVFDEFEGFNDQLETAEDVDFCRRIRSTYKIFLEKRIDTIHLRESKNIPDLFKRELHRGKFSIRQFIKSTDKRKDLASVLIPLIVFLSIIYLLLSYAVNINSSICNFLASSTIIFPLMLMIKKKSIITTYKDVLCNYTISFVYIMARTASLFYELITLITSQNSKLIKRSSYVQDK